MNKLVVYHPRAEEYASIVADRYPDLRISCVRHEHCLSAELAEADVLLTTRFPVAALEHAPCLRWIHVTTAGVDYLVGATARLKNVIVTNTRGIHADIVADYVFGVMLLHQWNFADFRRSQTLRTWTHRVTTPLSGKTIGIIGLGHVGTALAERANHFGMTTLGLRRTAEPSSFVARLFTRDELGDMLARCDFLVLVVPLTAETRSMLGEREFSCMKPASYLINVARGEVVDETALVNALRRGTIAGAALDVFGQEPLPPQNPLWGLDNVLLTPHVAGEAHDYLERVGGVFAENLGRWRRGDALRFVVDLPRGY